MTDQDRTLLNILDRSITFRFLAVIALIIGLMIPLFLVFNVVADRQNFYEEAVNSIAKSWAGSQLISGPVLVIPYELPQSQVNETGELGEIFVMPKTLTVNVHGTHEVRRKGIFEVPVLVAKTTLSGTFEPLDIGALQSKYGKLKLEHAQLVMGVGDALGVREAQLMWNQAAVDIEGTVGFGTIPDGIQANGIDVAAGGSFVASVDLRFTQRFGVLLVGDESRLDMTSTWPHPAFDGRSLPDSHDVSEDGFTAAWSSHALSRGYPSILTRIKWNEANRATGSHDSRPWVHAESIGFSVVEPVTPYRAVDRALKYGVMFIVLTLIGVLCIELVLKQKFHIVQYGVVGLALLMFYLVLLSLAEHVGFDWSYLIAALILSSMITLYSWTVTKHKPTTSMIGLMLAVLYVALYTILQLDQYSLLVGTALLLLLLAALMIATRNLHVEPTH